MRKGSRARLRLLQPSVGALEMTTKVMAEAVLLLGVLVSAVGEYSSLQIFSPWFLLCHWASLCRPMWVLAPTSPQELLSLWPHWPCLRSGRRQFYLFEDFQPCGRCSSLILRTKS